MVFCPCGLIEWDTFLIGGFCRIERTDIVKLLKFGHNLFPFGKGQEHRLGVLVFTHYVFWM
jgi:hypothetical protein